MSRPVRPGFHRSTASTPARRSASSGKGVASHGKSAAKVSGWTCRGCGTHNAPAVIECQKCGGHLPGISLFKAHTVIEGTHRFVRIKWETQEAESVRITPGRGDLPATGEIELDVEPDTIFSLVAGNRFGTRKLNTSITLAPPRITRFEAADTEIQIGYPVILSWEVENAARVELNRGIGDVTGRTFVEAHLDSPEPVILTVSNEEGKDSAQLTLSLPLPEIQSFYAGASHIPKEGTVPIYWQVANASEIVLSPHENEEPLEPLGSIEVRPTRNTRYKLLARNASGELSAEVSIQVPPPKIVVFGSPNGISTEGEAVMLTWEVDFAEEVRLEPNIGLVPPCGHTWVVPTQAFTFFTLTATGASGTISETYQITRFPIPLESELLLLPEETNIEMARQVSEKKTPLHDLQDMERQIQALTQSQLRELHIQQAKDKKLTYDLLDLKKASVRKELKSVLDRLKKVFKS